MIIHNKIKIYIDFLFIFAMCLGLSCRLAGQDVNVAPLATIDDAGLNYVTTPGSPPFVSNASYITDGNTDTTSAMDYQVAFDNASTKLLTFYLDQEYANITVKFFNSSIHNTSGINGTTFYLFNTDTFAVSPSQTLNESSEDGAHVIELAFITDDFTSGYNAVVFQFLNDNISFREIEIYGTPVDPSGGGPTVGDLDFWKAETAAPTGIYHDDGLVRIGSIDNLPVPNPGTSTYNSPRELVVNGHTIFNVGRGNVILENNILDDQTPGGFTLRTTVNPELNAPIFSVRSSGHWGRLWVGQSFSNFGVNDVYFGGSSIGFKANLIDEYTGVFTKEGLMGIGTIEPQRRLHIRGGAEGGVRLDRNQYGASIFFANYSSDWSMIENSGLVTLTDEGNFEIADMKGAVGGNDQEKLLSIDGTSYDVHLPNSLSVGTDAVKIDGAVAHFDGRVYVSEEDSLVDAATGESSVEKGFTDQAHDNYKEYLLWLEKGIVTQDIAIADAIDWPDYVFNETYELMTIEALKSFIKAHGHLPSMPSAKEVAKNGFTVSDMTKRTLKTIEEMTLYVVDHEEDLDSLQAEADERLAYLKNLLNKN